MTQSLIPSGGPICIMNYCKKKSDLYFVFIQRHDIQIESIVCCHINPFKNLQGWMDVLDSN